MIRNLLIAIILIGCGVLLFFSYSFLNEEAKKQRNPIETVPMDAAVIFKSGDVRSVWSRLSETNLVWSELLAIPEINNLDKTIRTADSLLSTDEVLTNLLHKKETVISLHSTGDGVGVFASSICTEQQVEAFTQLISDKGNAVESRNFEELRIISFSGNGKKYHYCYVQPFILFSSSSSHLEQSVTQLKNKESLLQNESFTELETTASQSAALNCFVNFKQLGRLMAPYVVKDVAEAWQSNKLFPGWAEFDLSLKSDALSISGLSTTDSENNFLNSMLSQDAQPSRMLGLLPKDIKLLKRISISNALSYVSANSEANIEALEQQCQCDPHETFSSWIGSEILYVEHSRTRESKSPIQTVIIENNGTENVLGRLSGLGVMDTVVQTLYGMEVYPVENSEFLKLAGGQFYLGEQVFFGQSEDYAVFSSLSGLSKIAYQWKKEEALVNQSQYIDYAYKYMANFSSNDYYSTGGSALAGLKELIKPEYYQKINQYQDVINKLGALSWQSSPSQNNYQYHSLAVNLGQSSSGGSGSLWSLALKTPIIRAPELMKNHRTNTLEVLVQDQDNVIHLISATGKIKWSKQLEGSIIGKVKQIDVYNNGKWQMLFNTDAKIHLVDINGNEVKGFPITSPSPITNSLSVFDYDKKHDYRIAVACSNQKIYLYDKEGKTVSGWKFNGAQDIIVNDIAHFRLEGKDYIMTNDVRGNVYVLDRRGGERETLTAKLNTNVYESIQFDKGFSFETCKLSYIDTLGNMCELQFNDSLTCYKLDSTHINYRLIREDLDNDKLFDFVVSFGNRLEVYGPDKKLSFFETFDFNLENGVQVIHGSNGNGYIVLSNENDIYLYTHKFLPVPEFPALGSRLTTIGDMNKDGKMDVITITGNNEMIVYSLEGLGGV